MIIRTSWGQRCLVIGLVDAISRRPSSTRPSNSSRPVTAGARLAKTQLDATKQQLAAAQQQHRSGQGCGCRARRRRRVAAAVTPPPPRSITASGGGIKH